MSEQRITEAERHEAATEESEVREVRDVREVREVGGDVPVAPRFVPTAADVNGKAKSLHRWPGHASISVKRYGLEVVGHMQDTGDGWNCECYVGERLLFAMQIPGRGANAARMIFCAAMRAAVMRLTKQWRHRHQQEIAAARGEREVRDVREVREPRQAALKLERNNHEHHI